MVNEFTQLGLNLNPSTKDIINNINPYDYIRRTGRPVRPIRYTAPGTGFQLVDTYNPSYNIVDDYALKYNTINPNKVQLPARINSNLPVVYKSPINTGVNKESVNIIDDVLYKDRAKDINEGISKIASKQNIKNTSKLLGKVSGAVAELAPLIGNAYDFAEGTDALRHGDIPAGLALYGLGTVGTLADIGSILTAPTGAGPVALQGGKIALKSAVRGAIKNKLARKALRTASKLNKNKLTGVGARTGASILLGINSGNKEEEPTKNINMKEKEDTQINNTQPFDVLPNYNYNYDIPVDDINNLLNQYGVEVDANNQQQINNNRNYQDVLEAYNKQYEAQQPYLEALGNYINNYKGLQEDAMIRDRGNVALAGLTGNAGYNQLVGRYNPATIEADRINLLNTLANIEAQRAGGLNELIGNMAIAEEMGLPIESAFGNKNLLTALTAYNKALYGLEGKKYTADRNYEARVIDTIYDNQIKLALQNNNIQLARELQNAKNMNRIQTALIGQSGFGDIDNIIRIANALGYNLNVNDANTNTDNIKWSE